MQNKQNILPFMHFRVQRYVIYLDYVLVFNIFFVLLHQKYTKIAFLTWLKN